MPSNWEDYTAIAGAVLSAILASLPTTIPWWIPIVLGGVVKGLKDIADHRKAKTS